MAILRFPIAISCVFLILTIASCNNGNVSEYIPPNEGIISFKDFYVTADSTALNTSARGTIYIEKDDSNNYTAQIVAWVDIDPMDYGGIEFDISCGWAITNVTSSYPDIGNNSLRFATACNAIENGQNSSNWSQRIVIGDTIHYSWSTSVGGNGSLIIELAAYPKGQQPLESLRIIAGVGSELSEEGYQVLYPDFVVVEVPIFQQDR